MLDVNDSVQTSYGAIIWSQFQQLLDASTGRGPVAIDILPVGFGEAFLVFQVDILPKFLDILILLELVPGCRLPLVELLMESPSHFIPYGFLLSDWHVSQRIVCWLQVFGLNIYSKKLHRVNTTNHGDCVDLAKHILELIRKKVPQMARDKDMSAKLFGGCL